MQESRVLDISGHVDRTDCGRHAVKTSERMRIVSSCGTLTNMGEFVRDKELGERMDAKCERMDSLIEEIQLLVDLLYLDHKLVIAPGGDA